MCVYIYIYVYIYIHTHTCKIAVIFLPDITKLQFSRQVLEKYYIIKFDENSSSGITVIACGWTDGHNQGIVAFRNFTNELKKDTSI